MKKKYTKIPLATHLKGAWQVPQNRSPYTMTLGVNRIVGAGT